MRETGKAGTLVVILGVAAVFAGCRAEPGTALERAAYSGDVGRLEALLAEGTGPDEADARGWTALHWAARGDQAGTVRALLRAGAEIDLRDHGPNGWTPLMHAIHKNAAVAARVFIEEGADVNARTGCGGSALIMAAGYGQTEIVRALLDHGADPYSEAGDGVTALWSAAGGGAIADITDGPPLGTCFPDTVALLRQAAPDLRLKRTWETRLLGVVARGEECERLLASLLEG